MQQKTYTQQEFDNALLLYEIKFIKKNFVKLEKKLKNCVTK